MAPFGFCQTCGKAVPPCNIQLHRGYEHFVKHQLINNQQVSRKFDDCVSIIDHGKHQVGAGGGTERKICSTSRSVNQSSTLNRPNESNVFGGKSTKPHVYRGNIAVPGIDGGTIKALNINGRMIPVPNLKRGSITMPFTVEDVNQRKRGVVKPAGVGANAAAAHLKRQRTTDPPVIPRSLQFCDLTKDGPLFKPQQRTMATQKLNNNNQYLQSPGRSNLSTGSKIPGGGTFGVHQKLINTNSVKMSIKRGTLNQGLQDGSKTRVSSASSSMKTSQRMPVDVPVRTIEQGMKQAFSYNNSVKISNGIKTKVDSVRKTFTKNGVGKCINVGTPAILPKLQRTTGGPMIGRSPTGVPYLPKRSSGKAIPVNGRNEEERHRSTPSESTGVRLASTALEQQTSDPLPQVCSDRSDLEGMETLKEVEVMQAEVKVEIKQEVEKAELEEKEELFGQLETSQNATIKSKPASRKSEEGGGGRKTIPPNKDFKPNNRFRSMRPISKTHKTAPGPPKQSSTVEAVSSKSLANGTKSESPIVAVTASAACANGVVVAKTSVVSSTAPCDDEKLPVPKICNPANPLNPLQEDNGKGFQNSSNGKSDKSSPRDIVPPRPPAERISKKSANVTTTSGNGRRARKCKKSTVEAAPAKHTSQKRAKGKKGHKKVNLQELKLYVPSMPGTDYELPELSARGYYTKKRGKRVWICLVCNQTEPKISSKAMISCDQDQCHDWYHLDCVGIRKAMPKKDPWYCLRCIYKSTRHPSRHFPELFQIDSEKN